MKIIRFKQKKNYNYKRKVFVRDLVLNILVGIHNFEKKKKQRVKFNIDIAYDPKVLPNKNNLSIDVTSDWNANEDRSFKKTSIP